MFNRYRTEIPYHFEIVLLDGAVGLVNTVKWNKRDLIIICRDGKGFKKKVIMQGEKNEIIIPELENEKRYKFTISRNDLIGKLKYKSKIIYAIPKAGGSKYIVLVGASVGRHWHFSELSERLGNDKYSFGYRGKGSFDKEEEITGLIISETKPDAVIIKECAAYFPRGIKESKDKIDKWVGLLIAKDIAPILATCAPVTHENDKNHAGRQKSLLNYNKFIRNYAEKKKIAVLDLEKALRDDSTDSKYLKKEFAKNDGLHLNKRAYSDALDLIILPTLEEAFKK